MARVQVWRPEDELRPGRGPGRPGVPAAWGGGTGAQEPGGKANSKRAEADEELVGRLVRVHLLGPLAGAGTDGRVLLGTLRRVTKYLLPVETGGGRRLHLYKHAVLALEVASQEGGHEG
ncbi:MAG: hypothetical protein QME87_03590 [Bacillota bacterium]|nr:hypothetical protein [Bacillota bacterium]